jgi:hypothetical protein
MGGSDNSENKTVIRRYADYVESKHSHFLNSMYAKRQAVINNSPFVDYTDLEVSEAFFGIGYLISSFPSLYEMFGKHMAGLDIEGIWNSTFENVFSNPEINLNVSERMKLVDDELVKGELADYQVNMRNLNAVNTSSFVVGKAVNENKRLKVLAKISLEVKVDLLSVVGKDYASHLNWEKSTITVYAKVMKEYFVCALMAGEANYKFASRDALWPFTVLSYEGWGLGVIRGASWIARRPIRERSAVSKTLLVASYGVTGAMIGTEILPGWGTAIGAVVGLLVGLAAMLLE